MEAILGTTYFGPVQWYQKLNRYDYCLVEQCDSFVKQTFRNRCMIATTAGTQMLSIPVEHGAKLMKDIKISDHGNWRHLHWKALVSAYGESPFFEFYADDLRPFFEKKWEYLIDFNMEIMHKMAELIDFEPNVSLTTDFRKEYPEDVADFRNVIDPKHPQEDKDFEPREYYQVYKEKHGFMPNLSILDLLFNEGNETILYL
jgi:hypothetical protein